MTPPGIQIEHLRFRIGSFEIPDLSLAIPRGEYVVLTGPNGAGKTALLKLLAGLFQPRGGRIAVDGREVTHLPPWERNMGAIQQEGLLFPNRTVRRNIEFGLEIRRLAPRARREAAERMADQLNIRHLLDRTPEGLSGGERQKVSLARALVLEPAVLLLDEPVSAVDEKSRDDLLVRELLPLQRRLGITTLHVAHNRQEIQLVADRVVHLADGRIVEGPDSAGPSSNPGKMP